MLGRKRVQKTKHERGHEEFHQETTVSWMMSLMRRCGDIQPNPGPTQSAAAAAAATVNAHHNNVLTSRAVRQSRNRLQRETDLVRCATENTLFWTLHRKCTRDRTENVRCYHYHSAGVCEFAFSPLLNGELGIVTRNCTTLRNLTRHDLVVGQADQWSVICLQGHIALVARQLAVYGTTVHSPHECSPVGFSSQAPDGATRRLRHGHSHSRRDLDASC